MLEACIEEVTVCDFGLLEVGLGEVHTFQLAMRKSGLSELHLIESGMVNHTLVKGDRKAKGITPLKLKAEQLTVPEADVLESRIVYVGVAEVAFDKLTLHKFDVNQVNTMEIAMGEGAAFIFPLFEGLIRKIELPELFVCHIF